jgi:hypothetical protein
VITFKKVLSYIFEDIQHFIFLFQFIFE